LQADWCPDCRDFQPALNAFYKTAGTHLDVVFVGSDRSEDAQQEHFTRKQGNWWALPFDSPLRDALKRKVRGLRGRRGDTSVRLTRCLVL
jgi:nucleoredoxin